MNTIGENSTHRSPGVGGRNGELTCVAGVESSRRRGGELGWQRPEPVGH